MRGGYVDDRVSSVGAHSLREGYKQEKYPSRAGEQRQNTYVLTGIRQSV